MTIADRTIKHIFDNTSDGVLIVDQQGIISYANPSAHKLCLSNGDPLIGSIFPYSLSENEIQNIEISPANSNGNQSQQIIELKTVKIQWEDQQAFLVLGNAAESKSQKPRVATHGQGHPYIVEVADDGELVVSDVLGSLSDLTGLDTTQKVTIADLLPFIIPEDLDKYDRHLRLLLSNTMDTVEFNIAVGEKQRAVSNISIPIYDQIEGRVTRIVCIARKLSEFDLTSKYLEQYYALIDGTSELVCRFLKDGTITFINQGYWDFFNKTPQELVGYSIFDSIHKDDRDNLLINIEMLSSSANSFSIELRSETLAGGVRWLEWNVLGFFDIDGCLIELQSVGREITEHMAFQNALMESENRYRAVVEDQTELILRTTPNGTILFVNSAYCRYFGLSSQELVGDNFFKLLPDTDRKKVQDAFTQLSVEHPIVQVENGGWTKDNGLCYQLWVDRGFFDADGNLVEIQSVGRDITEQRLAELKLERHQRLLKAVNFIAEELFKTQDWQEVISLVMERIGVASSADLVYVIRKMPSKEGAEHFELKHFWKADGQNDPTNFAFSGEAFRDWVDKLARKETVCGGSETFTPDMQDFLGNYHIQNIVLVPIFVGDDWWGVAGLDKRTCRADWSQSEIDVLRTAVEILGAAIQRERIQTALKENEAKFRTVANFTYAWEYWVDPNDQVVHISPSAKRLTGYKPEEFVNNPSLLDQIIYPEDLAIYHSYLENEVKRRRTASLDFRIISKDQAIRWVSHKSLPVYDDQGTYLGRRVSVFNVHQEKLAQQVVRELNEKLEQRVLRRTEQLETANLFLQSLLDSIPNAVFFIDHEGVYTNVNKTYTQYVGKRKEEIIGKDVFDIWPKEIAESFYESDQALIATQGRIRYETQLQIAENDLPKDFTVNKVTYLQSNGDVGGIVGIMADISDLKQTEIFLEDQRTILQMIAQDRLLEEILGKLMGMIENQQSQMTSSILLLENNLFNLVSGSRLPQNLASLLDGMEVSQSDCFWQILKSPNKRLIISNLWSDSRCSNLHRLYGEIEFTSACFVPILSSQNEVLGILAIFCETSTVLNQVQMEKLETFSQFAALAIERNRMNNRLIHQAKYDSLTDLPNRHLLEEVTPYMLTHADETGALVGVIVLDLDHFKDINDSLGRSIGDEVLKQISRRLSLALRPGCVLARLERYDFAMVVNELRTTANLDQIVEALEYQFSQPIQVENHEVYVNASIGYSVYPDDGSSLEVLLKNAGNALTVAKSNARTQVMRYKSYMKNMALERLRMVTQLRRSIEQNDFILYYQPQIDFKTGKVWGVEALIRWHNPEYGIVSPDVFISTAEESGLIHAIGEWVLREAVQQLASWQSEGLEDMQMAVNVSPLQLARADFVQTVLTIIEEYGINPGFLVLEITESVFMGDVDEAVGRLSQLREAGITIHVDDFGTEYSSLAYLKYLPVDCLKIARNFINDLTEEQQNGVDIVEMVRAIIALGHSLGLKVLAEGVETEEQATILKSLGCDLAQGYLYSRPIPSRACVVKINSLNQL
jgi:diguanylate cyclase (GGDEF)-like protein/PAS domain S-box-containing protein